MAKKVRRPERKEPNLRVGEVIRIESIFHFPPPGVYRVEEAGDHSVALSAGRLQMGLSRSAMLVLERGLPEPESWLPIEISALRAQAAMCECSDCRRELEAAEIELKLYQAQQRRLREAAQIVQ